MTGGISTDPTRGGRTMINDKATILVVEDDPIQQKVMCILCVLAAI